MKTYLDKQKTARLSRCSRILKWLLVANIAASVLSNSAIITLIPFLEFPGKIFGVLVSLIYCLVLLRMAFASDGFKYAAYMQFILIAITPAVMLLRILEGSSSWVQDLAVFLSALLACFSRFQEFRGHEEAIMSADPTMSERWALLWKICMYTYFLLIPSTLISMYFPLIGLILILLCTIALIVVQIRQFILLEDTAKAYDAWEPVNDQSRSYRYF